MTPPARARAPEIPFWIWACLPVLAGAALRFRGIGEAGPFVDEGANILTALDPRVREAFEPLGQGRPWLVLLFRPSGWFPAQALEVARLMSALAGLATMAALGWTLHRLAGRMAALAGLWIWAVMPFATWHERLALQDPFVTALLAGSLALLVAGAPTRHRWLWLAAGVLGGMAFLMKISALFAVPWLGLVYLAVQRTAARPAWDHRLGFVALGTVLPLLTLGTDLWELGGKLDRYGALPSANTSGFAGSALERLGVWVRWYQGYGGWPLLVLLVAGWLIAVKSRHWLSLGCAAAWGVALMVTALGYNNTYARYALPDQLPLVLFLALAIGSLTRVKWVALVLLAPLAWWGGVTWRIGTSPEHAPVPASEISQYLTGPWSGRGVPGLRKFLAGHADANQVQCVVLTHRFLRPGCYGLLLAELGDPRINVVPVTVYEPADLDAVRPGLLHIAKDRRVAFFLLYEGSLYPAHPWLDAAGSTAQLVHKEPRGPGEEFALYRFEP